MLMTWRQFFNLTAIKDPYDILLKHILDSLVIAKYLKNLKIKSIIDVGSGAGLPGIPLSLALPDKLFTLIDSTNKKTKFLNLIKQDLNLTNVTIITERVEKYYPDKLFDGVITRAFGQTKDFLQKTKHLGTVKK